MDALERRSALLRSAPPLACQAEQARELVIPAAQMDTYFQTNEAGKNE